MMLLAITGTWENQLDCVSSALRSPAFDRSGPTGGQHHNALLPQGLPVIQKLNSYPCNVVNTNMNF